MEKKIILVPTDFTLEADCAVNHAIGIAKTTGHEICLCHIIDEKTAELLKKEKRDISYVHGLLDEQVEKIKALGLKASHIARHGTIFTTIGEIVEETSAGLLIFGTHGAKGLQKIFGAFAIKLAVSSKAPVIIVQRKHIGPEGYKKILIPADNSTFTKQKAYQAANLAKYFGAEIHIYPKFVSDEFISNQIKNNVAYMKSVVKEEGLSCVEVDYGHKESGPFSKQIIEYAHHVGADLIAIITDDDKDLFDFSNDDVKIINNEYEIPTLCINPINTMVLGSVISFGGFS